MKIPIKISIFVIAILLVMLIQMALTSRNARASENENSLAAAVEQALEQLVSEGYEISSYDELVADFNQRLLLQINSDSDIQVEALTGESDMEKGILDIRVTEKYRTIKGNEKENVCRKTVFLEQFTDNYEKGYHTISFLANGNIFSQYTLYAGSRIVDPGMPELEGRVFQYWKLEDSDEPADLGNMTVGSDLAFRAVFN